MRRLPSKFLCERLEVEIVARFKRILTQPMLLGMMVAAKAEHIAIRGLEPGAPVGPARAHLILLISLRSALVSC